jgi:hypothetical protein
MAKDKKTIRKSKSKSRRRRARKSLRKYTGGDCGCNKRPMIGGASFNGSLSSSNYYPRNDEVNNPNDPSVMQSARNVPDVKFGGRKRKMKGGYSLLGPAFSTSPFMSFGNSDGAQSSVDVLYGNPQVNPSASVQITGFSNTISPLA